MKPPGNGVVPRDMRHFVELVEGAEETLQLDTSSDGRMVFDVAEARAAHERILRRYQIPADRSADLRG